MKKTLAPAVVPAREYYPERSPRFSTSSYPHEVMGPDGDVCGKQKPAAIERTPGGWNHEAME